MKLRFPLWLLAAFLAPAVALAVPAQKNAPPEGPQCLDANNISAWSVVDDHTLIARNGPHRFVITTKVACPYLGQSGLLRFKTSNDKAVTLPGRICGDVGETVSSRHNLPCAIKSVQRVDEQTYETLKKRAEQHRHASD